MGFLDDVQASISRGTEAVGRGTKSTQLKMRQNDLLKERQKLAAQLGAALYEKFKDDADARVGTEALFDGIASIDAQRADIQAQIDTLAAEAQASQAAAVVYTCPGCGSKVPATDLFCSGCGKPIADIKAAAPAPVAPAAPVVSGPACPSCGAPMADGDVFCMSCGARVDAVVPEPPAGIPTVVPGGAADPVAPIEHAEPSEVAAFDESVEAAGSVVEISDDDAASLQSSASSCPGCGAPITSEDVFCGSCGYNLQGA